MIPIRFNFAHPFQGKVLLRKLDCKIPWCSHLHFDSDGQNDFSIPLEVQEDGRYRVILDWEHEGRIFFHHSEILVRASKLVIEHGFTTVLPSNG